jgi:ribosomal protein S18 acetylase RimI-like enzyme
MSVDYRLARPEEYGAVAEVLVAAYLADGLIPTGTGYERHLSDVAGRAEDSEVVVADEDGEILGTVTFCPNGSKSAEISSPGEGEFRMLGVDPGARGRGIGAGLASFCVERSRELGYRAVMLSSAPTMRAAHRLYEAMGFVRVPELDWSPNSQVDLLAYRLVLTDPAG